MHLSEEFTRRRVKSQHGCTPIFISTGYIAQWLEWLTADQQVPGSNPGVPSLHESFSFAQQCAWFQTTSLGLEMQFHFDSTSIWIRLLGLVVRFAFRKLRRQEVSSNAFRDNSVFWCCASIPSILVFKPFLANRFKYHLQLHILLDAALLFTCSRKCCFIVFLFTMFSCFCPFCFWLSSHYSWFFHNFHAMVLKCPCYVPLVFFCSNGLLVVSRHVFLSFACMAHVLFLLCSLC